MKCNHKKFHRIANLIHWCLCCGAIRDCDYYFGEALGPWRRPGYTMGAIMSRDKYLKYLIASKKELEK